VARRFLFGFVITLLIGAAVGGAWLLFMPGAEERVEAALERARKHVPEPIERMGARTQQPSKIIYLNREGATLRPGVDDSAHNRSSILRNHEVEVAHMPAFAGSARTWRTFVDCVREHFGAFDVQVVDQRPVEGSYVMAVVGGTPVDLGDGRAETGKHGHAHQITGLAPFDGNPVRDAVVLVFSRSLKENPKDMCETAAMEIAHAFGLDHTHDCGDLMTYLRPCKKLRFLDKDAPCGEHEPRACADARPTQNSHAKLLQALGPAGTVARSK